MINIQLTDSLRIRSDEYNYILEKKSKGKKETMKTKGYYQNMGFLADDLIEMEITNSDAKTLKDIQLTISALKDAVIRAKPQK